MIEKGKIFDRSRICVDVGRLPRNYSVPTMHFDLARKCAMHGILIGKEVLAMEE